MRVSMVAALASWLHRRKCARSGHVRPTVSWYASRRNVSKCQRCGAEVAPILDMRGHP